MPKILKRVGLNKTKQLCLKNTFLEAIQLAQS